MTSFDCTDIQACLSGFIDDEIDATKRHLAERHLASCAACRALVSEAESLNELIALDAASLVPARLSPSFIDSVMSRTVYARAYEQAGWNWTSWLGWVAAAACLGLAGSLWFLDRQMPNNNNQIARGGSVPPTMIDDGSSVKIEVASTDLSPLRSWTFDDGLPMDAFESRIEFASLDESTMRAIDDGLSITLPSPSELSAMSRNRALSDDDQQTLYQTSIVLGMLAESDVSSFGDVERVRQIAEYDELPQRLAQVRARLQPADRAIVLAAESILLRIVHGPLDLEDLRMVHDTAGSMDLAQQVASIGAAARDVSATSL